MNNMLTDKENQAVLDILVKELGVHPEQLTPDARIQEDLGADSLSIMEITIALEEQFQVMILDDELERISTVEDLYEAVAKVMGRVERLA